MATKIVTKNSSTGGSAPSTSDLVQGELAVNVTDKRLYTENASGAIVELGTNPLGAVTMASTLGVTGVLTATSLDISGNIDVDGTTNLDVVDIDGAVDMASTLAVGGAVTSPSFATTAGGTFTTAAGNDLNIVYPANRSLFIKEGSSTHLTIDNAGTATFNAGITTTAAITGGSYNVGGTAVIDSGRNLVNMGNVNGAAGIFGSLAVDNFTLNGTTLALSSGNLTLDVAGDIILDADGGDITFNDGGTTIGQIRNSSSDLVFQSSVSDKDIKFVGNDGGSDVTALTLDMSAAGAATFNAGVFAGSASSFPSIKVNNNSYIGSANNATAIQIATSGAVTFSSAMTALSASASVVTAYLANSSSSIANSASSILYLQTSGDAAIQDGYKMVTFADSDTVLGSISTSASSSNVAYNTSSDERLKENIVDMPSQLANILKVQPRQFDWKKHGNTATGFIAQELHKTYPEAVSVGLEDETQDPWSVDYGRLTPYIIKAMQEQQTLIETLTARITALEE